MTSIQVQASVVIRLLETGGCIFHNEWYPEPGVARLSYTSEAENHCAMWEIEIRARAATADPS